MRLQWELQLDLYVCSGHGAMKENHFLDDGAYSAVQIIIETVRRRLAGQGDIAAELLKQLKEPKHSSEYRLKITVIYPCCKTGEAEGFRRRCCVFGCHDRGILMQPKAA